MKNKKLITALVAVLILPLVTPSIAQAAPVPKVDLGSGKIPDLGRTQVSFDHTPTNVHLGTANEFEPRPGLSLVKLYIADYVFKYGDPADMAKAEQMIRVSDDNIATELYRKYPDSINSSAREYGLVSTSGAAHWGNSRTSSADTNSSIVTKKRTDPNSPVLRAMTQMSPIAADGYLQDYGTTTLPGVTGSKLGWSDDRSSYHASVSFGNDFVVSANTNGTKFDNTNDVQNSFTGIAIPELPNLNINSSNIQLPIPQIEQGVAQAEQIITGFIGPR